MLKINETLFILLFVSLAIDWMFQTHWEATNKFKDWKARLKHSLIYSILTLILLRMYGFQGYVAFTIFGILAVTHFIIDKRTIVKWWMENMKGMPKYIVKYPDPITGVIQIGIDQWMHIIVHLTIATIFYNVVPS